MDVNVKLLPSLHHYIQIPHSYTRIISHLCITVLGENRTFGIMQ